MESNTNAIVAYRKKKAFTLRIAAVGAIPCGVDEFLEEKCLLCQHQFRDGHGWPQLTDFGFGQCQYTTWHPPQEEEEEKNREDGHRVGSAEEDLFEVRVTAVRAALCWRGRSIMENDFTNSWNPPTKRLLLVLLLSRWETMNRMTVHFIRKYRGQR